jgi:DNA-directed RNA polymerase subunit RPC12/RpoP
VLYFTFAFSISCPKCTRHLLIQWTEHPPHAEKTKRVEGWAAIVLKVARNHDFLCMYCGQRFFMKPKGLCSIANT